MLHFIFYEFINANVTARQSFNTWKSEFTAIHGFLDTQRKLDVGGLGVTYTIDCSDEENIFELVFCLETYYTIVLRTLAFQTVFKEKTLSIDAFNADFFKEKGILNYFSKPYFNWFLALPDVLEDINICAKQYNHFLLNPETDFIKSIFENVFPSAVRHAMGEFYTPDWLANFVIETLTENDENAHQKTYLDPTCGSGTFIFNVIKQFQAASDNQIFKQVYGIDLNPVSVLAAKTNYLILYAQAQEFSKDKPLKIPIYYADAIQAKFQNSNDLFAKKANDFEDIDIKSISMLENIFNIFNCRHEFVKTLIKTKLFKVDTINLITGDTRPTIVSDLDEIHHISLIIEIL